MRDRVIVHRSRLRVLGPAVAVVVALALTGCAANPTRPAAAHPTPTERNGSTGYTDSTAYRVFAAKQERVDRFVAWVRSHRDLGGHGYITSVVDPAHLRVTMLWHGHDPLAATLVAAGPRFRVTVRVQQRAQSLAQFVAAQQRLARAAPQLKRLGFSISLIDGIGARPAPLTVVGELARGADRVAVERAAARAAGQPVLVRIGSARNF